MRLRPYVGISHSKDSVKIMSRSRVTTQTHPEYRIVKGPFKTHKGADYFHVHPNPLAMSVLSVNELEKLAAEIAN